MTDIVYEVFNIFTSVCLLKNYKNISRCIAAILKTGLIFVYG